MELGIIIGMDAIGIAPGRMPHESRPQGATGSSLDKDVLFLTCLDVDVKMHEIAGQL